MAGILLAHVFQKCFFRLAADSRRMLRSGCLASAMYLQLGQKGGKNTSEEEKNAFLERNFKDTGLLLFDLAAKLF